MTTHEKGYQVLRGLDVDPRSAEGLGILASMLASGAETQDVETFDVSWAAGDGHPRHHHNIGLAVAITQGSVTFLFGSEGERQEARKGDYVLIGAATLHDELTADGVEMVGAHIGPLETYDE
jgi:quercetin dioxygenase-like cupin family protein